MNNPICQTLRLLWVVFVAVSVCYELRAQEVQPIIEIEYFFDEDPGMGKATKADAAVGANGYIAFSPSTSALSQGNHLLGLRAYRRNDEGVYFFSPTIVRNLVIPEEHNVSTLQYAEFFFDEDPGYGCGLPIIFQTDGLSASLNNVSLSAEGLSAGSHTIGIRSYSTQGWSPTVVSNIVIPMTHIPSTLQYAEYFFDKDPGYGQGYPILLSTDGHAATMSNVSLSTEGLSAGDHTIGLRMFSTQGWSPTIVNNIVVPQIHDANVTITYGEFFWNEDPGYGNGSPIAIASGKNVTLDNISLQADDINGTGTLHLRFQGVQGWGPTLSYTVLVNVEGNYTLNTTAETSAATRNFQSLYDMINELDTRNVGDDVLVTVVGNGTDYALDLSADDMMDKLVAITSDMNEISSQRNWKSLGFQASEGTNNTLSLTVADSDLPTVMEFLAHTWTENVTLTVNGEAYNFAPVILHHDEICSGCENVPVELISISNALTASWTAQPHEGTTLSGYQTSGTGDLPAMTLTNSGTRCDSIDYQITLSNAGGTPLLTYTYRIYVHARVNAQTFSGLKPVSGTISDPVVVTLKWNPIGDAVSGYRLDVSSLTIGADANEEPQVETFSTNETSYVLTLAVGRVYTWTVTAIGYCDELTSPAMMVTGRNLPDLVVGDIQLPEGAESGNTITVTATIQNIGNGATTESSWKDVLYYTIDSEDFVNAVKVTELTHNGNLEAGGSYQIQFQITVPTVEQGNLRMFVVTDSKSKVMESDDTNNRTMSEICEINPFYVNTEDLLALRSFYDNFGGNKWTGTHWCVDSEIIRPHYWSGVTFNTEGRVTAINLQNRGLMGTLSAATALNLPALTSLNLSHNYLKGDVTPFVTSEALTSLNLSYNEISEISAPLPSNISSLKIGSQVIPDAVNFDLVTMMDDEFVSRLPTIVRYDHKTQSYVSDIKLKCLVGDDDLFLNRSHGETTISTPSPLLYNKKNGETLVVCSESGLASGTSFQISVSFPEGDATFNGITDILDLQATINYMFYKWNGSLFNYTAANLYPDENINIQDAIRLIDLLINEPWVDHLSRTRNAPLRHSHFDAPAQLVVEGDILKLSTTTPVAALDIYLSDCDIFSDEADFMFTGLKYNTRKGENYLHLIAYSFSGTTLPIGETILGRLEGRNPQILRAQLSDADANEVRVDINHTTTGIQKVSTPIAFKLYSIAGILLKDGTTSELKPTLDSLPTGTYILQVSYGSGKVKQSKIHIESR